MGKEVQSASARPRQIGALLFWLAVSFCAAAAGGIASANAGTFYAQLSLPPWAPPAWLFAPVWTLLYLMMGVAAWLVWRERAVRPVKAALSLFVIQLIANGLWTWLFFAWQKGALAFVEIILLLVLIVATLLASRRARPLAGALLLPYLVWVAFATALTWACWTRNPQLLG